MDAIKKKMLAMKMEKEVATDKAEQTEQSLRDLEDAKNKVRLVQHHFSFASFSFPSSSYNRLLARFFLTVSQIGTVY